MSLEPEKRRVAANERESATALIYFASKPKRLGVTIILGHGAGVNQLSSFMRLFASGLSERGFDVMTFNFLYMEQGRRVPDPKAKLESCYRAVIEAARRHKKLKGNRLVIGGKSMGGRIASQVAAAIFLECGGSTPLSKTPKSQRTPNYDISGLVFLGYPLHPPGKPEQLRDAHLKDIRAPMLFMQGSRDAFGTPDELRAVIKKHRLPASLYVIEGGDHSFKVPKSSGLLQQQVYDSAMDEIARWLKTEVRNPEH